MAVNRVRRFVSTSTLLALTLLLFPTPVQVQTPAPDGVADQGRDFSQDVPAHFTRVDGQVTLVRDGRLEPAEANQILLAGDRLRTAGGRVQILFADGSTLAVDENTTLDLLSDSLVRLIDGRLFLTMPRTAGDLDYRVDTAAGFAEIRSAGEYRVQTGADRRGKLEVDLIVYRGTAELGNDFGRTLLRAGRHAVTSADTEPSLPYAINSAAWDEFDQWVDGLRETHVISAASPSANYLPEESAYYATTLDTYGSWDYIAPYGAVWYPHVSAGWRPYGQGRWSYTGHYGWNWMGNDSWAWPTHHYGSWGISNAGWYWMPGTRWGPAWVSWGGTVGYVGWCPIGYNGYPVVGFGVASPYYAGQWSAWTMMPAHTWTHNVWVTDHRMGYDAMPPGARNGFAPRRGGPSPMGDAPRRDIAPIGSPTMPRDAAGLRSRNVANSVEAGRGGRPAGATAGLPAPTRGSAAMPQSREAIPRATANDRGAAPGGFPAVRAFPQTATGVPAAGATRGSPSRADARPDAPSGFPPSASSNRAVPRQTGPASISPSMGADSSRDVRRAPEAGRAAPLSGGRASSPSAGRVAPWPASSAIDRGRAVERNPAPSAYGAPAPPAVSSPSRRAPSTAPPQTSAPSAPSAPPASRGRTVAPSAPPSAPPPAASAGRGGGGGSGSAGGQGAAVPRRGRGSS